MGNGVFCKTIGYCNQDQNIPKSDIYIIKSLDESQYQLNYLNYIIAKNANEKEFNNIIKKRNSKQSNGSRQIFVGDNSSTINNGNLSISNATFQMYNSNIIRNNLVKKNLNRKILNCVNPSDVLRHKNSIINFNKCDSYLRNNLFKIKTKLLFTGNLFQKKSIVIDKYGMKNGLRQKHDGLVIFGFKDKNGASNAHHSDYYFNLEKTDESENNSKMTGRVFEIYLSKASRRYTLYFLHPSLILYYKINNVVYFEAEKDYFIIIGDIFLTIQIKREKDSNEKVMIIHIELENEKPQKFTFTQGDMPIKIGRVNCNIEILKPSISKLHSIIEFKDDNYCYKDCGSTNGSTLLIREDDSLQIMGEMSFKLEDTFFKIKEIDDDNYISEEENV